MWVSLSDKWENDLDNFQDFYVRYLWSIISDPLSVICVFFWPLLRGPTQGELWPAWQGAASHALTSGPILHLSPPTPELCVMPQAVIPQIPARFIGYILQNISCLLLPISGGKLHNEPSTPPSSLCLGSDFPIFELSSQALLCGKVGLEILFSIKCKFSACFLPWLHRGKKAEIKSS